MRTQEGRSAWSAAWSYKREGSHSPPRRHDLRVAAGFHSGLESGVELLTWLLGEAAFWHLYCPNKGSGRGGGAAQRERPTSSESH